nr:hypothetical protein [Sedimentibacter sp.]
MTVTLFSVITSILLCNVYIIVIACMRKRNGFLIRFSLVSFQFFSIIAIAMAVAAANMEIGNDFAI